MYGCWGSSEKNENENIWKNARNQQRDEEIVCKCLNVAWRNMKKEAVEGKRRKLQAMVGMNNDEGWGKLVPGAGVKEWEKRRR